MMSQARKKIALAVCSKVIEYIHSPLREFLDDLIIKNTFAAFSDAKSIDIEIVDWRNKEINFLQFDTIVVTSTWDLHLYPDEFNQWLNHCEADGKKRLINDIDILKLGIKKHAYLQPLLEEFKPENSAIGSMIPTIFVGVDAKTNSEEKFSAIVQKLIIKNPEIWSGDIVVKPNTSANGDNTFVVTQDEKQVEKTPLNYRHFRDMDKLFCEMLKIKKYNGLMIQPFMKAVEKHGEYQLVFFNNKCNHATVKPAGFKNSSPQGRMSVSLESLPKNMLLFAEKIMQFFNEKFPDKITRARVDLFDAGEKGPIVCEVEMVEPNTNINRLEKTEQVKAATSFVNAILLRRKQLLSLNLARNVRLFSSPKIQIEDQQSPNRSIIMSKL